MIRKTKIEMYFENEAGAIKAYEIADGMIRIHYSPEPYNGTVLTEEGDIRSMRLGEKYLSFGKKARAFDPIWQHPDCALSSLSLEGKTLVLGECSDLQGSMDICLACESQFFMQLLFTAAILAPEKGFQAFCLYEELPFGKREETEAVYKDSSLVLNQRGRRPWKEAAPLAFEERAEWTLKGGRFTGKKMY